MMKTENSKNVKYYIHVAIMLYFYFGFRFISPFASVTEVGMQLMGVFLGMVWGWMFVDMLWPSLLGLIALGLTDYFPNVLAPIAAGASNSNVILIFLFFVFSQYLEESGLSKTIAFKMLTAKVVQGKPWALCLMIFLASYVLAIVINLYAVIFLFWAIIYDMCKMAGYDKKQALPAFLLVGVVQTGAIGGCIMPFQVFPVVCLNALSDATSLTIPLVPFMTYNFLVTLASVILYWAVGKYILKIDVSKFESLSKEKILNGNIISYGRDQKIATAILVAFLVMILVPTFLPDGNMMKTLYTKFGNQGILAILLCLVCAIKINDKPLTMMGNLINKGVNWSLMFLLMATFIVGGAVNSDEAGIIASISSVLTPIFSSMSPLIFLIAAVVLLVAITQVAHNLVLAVVFIPLLSTMAVNNPHLGPSIAIIITLSLAVALLQALVTPAASNRGALIFGSDWIGRDYALKYGAVAVITCVLMVLIVGIPVGFLLF